MTTRNKRQTIISEWCKRCFGEIAATSNEERAERFLEEAIEVFQALGMAQSRLEKIASHIYSKPPGKIKQEIGGVQIALLALCENLGISADKEEVEEAHRILSLPEEYFRARQNIKAQAGVALPGVSDE